MTALCHIDLELDGEPLQARIVGAIPAADIAGIMAVVTRAILAGQHTAPAVAAEVETAPAVEPPKPAPTLAATVASAAAAKRKIGPRSDGRVTAHGYAKLRGINSGNIRAKFAADLRAIAVDGLLDPAEADRVLIARTKPDTQIGRIVRQAAGVANEPDGRLTPYEYGRLRGSASSVYRLSAELGPILVDGRLDPHEADQLLVGLTKPASALGQAVRQALQEAGIDPGDRSQDGAAAAPEPIEPEPPAEEAAPGHDPLAKLKMPVEPEKPLPARPNGHTPSPQPISIVAQAAARWLGARGDLCKRPYPETAPGCWRVGKQELSEKALIAMALQKGAKLPEVLP